METQFVTDLYHHFLRAGIQTIPIASLFNPLYHQYFDYKRYIGDSKPLHIIRRFGSDLFDTDEKDNIMIKGVVKRLYSGRNIQVTMTKKPESIEQILSDLDRPLSTPRFRPIPVSSGAGEGAGTASISIQESSRKRPLEDPREPVAKRAEPEGPKSEIRQAISMLEQIEELERIVAENEIRKADLSAKIAKQVAQLKALSSLDA
jgi:hypothetical protein